MGFFCVDEQYEKIFQIFDESQMEQEMSISAFFK